MNVQLKEWICIIDLSVSLFETQTTLWRHFDHQYLRLPILEHVYYFLRVGLLLSFCLIGFLNQLLVNCNALIKEHVFVIFEDFLHAPLLLLLCFLLDGYWLLGKTVCDELFRCFEVLLERLDHKEARLHHETELLVEEIWVKLFELVVRDWLLILTVFEVWLRNVLRYFRL